MKRLLLVLVSIIVPIALGCAGALIAVLTHPDANIDQDGWRLAWTGFGCGMLAGIASVWWFWRRRVGMIVPRQ